ncbi:MAG: DUF302 domain-containing protein [Acidobacteria bacterium]|nr:DUF302 domain-containing protein [Acidobacteriota bacterium]MCI0719348.1 DUF302 domain-containing protein [Acidobacteriota bacterium]
MTTQATATLVVPEPFDKALKLIRQALTSAEIGIAMELDVSGRIQRDLGVELAPCRILSVDNPFVLLEAMALDGTAAVFLPLHVAVSGDGKQTRVHMLSQSGVRSCGSPLGAKGAMSKLQAGLAQALEKISVRQGLAQISS